MLIVNRQQSQKLRVTYVHFELTGTMHRLISNMHEVDVNKDAICKNV